MLLLAALLAVLVKRHSDELMTLISSLVSWLVDYLSVNLDFSLILCLPGFWSVLNDVHWRMYLMRSSCHSFYHGRI